MSSIEIWFYVYILIIAFIFGSVFGSFINCFAWRIVHHESILKGRSHCTTCGHVLGTADLIPVFSYLFLHGKCRYCGQKISPRYMITELLLGAYFAALAARYGIQFATLRYMVLAVILLGTALTDLDDMTIPDSFTFSGMIWWAVCVVLCAVFPALAGPGEAAPLLSQLFSVEAVLPSWNVQLLQGLTGGFAIAGCLFLLSLLFDKITGKESLGGGDIKLFFMVSLFLGPWTGLLNLILSCITGLIFVAAMRSKRIPFGPAIAVSTAFCVIFGQDMVKSYLSLF
jgi:leader peptidase (prepilin peptidase)/N-methyltransferase